MQWGLSLNLGKDMDVFKYILPQSTLNRRQAASPLTRLGEGEERWEPRIIPMMFSSFIGVELSQIVLSAAWCSKLRLAPYHDEFRKALFDVTIDQVYSPYNAHRLSYKGTRIFLHLEKWLAVGVLTVDYWKE
ncbi:hypothetical protein TNCV_3148861 [Trichonephila clavipes]|nr:hypothetical protein TNCV_3148861 [Trichonephila clavipes]